MVVYRKPDIEPVVPLNLMKSPELIEKKKRYNFERRKTVEHNIQHLISESKMKYQQVIQKEMSHIKKLKQK